MEINASYIFLLVMLSLRGLENRKKKKKELCVNIQYYKFLFLKRIIGVGFAFD